MSLEERIRRFAEQARGYLLEEFARSTQKDTEVVQWQQYNEDGKLIVRDKDLNPVVDGVGQKYQTKGSDLILDSAGTVEQRKARRRQELVVPEKQITPLPLQAIVPRSANPIIDLFFLEEFEEFQEIYGWILIYHSDPYINLVTQYSAGSSFAGASDNSYDPYYGVSGYDSDSHDHSQPATYGKCFRVSTVYTYIRTDGSIADPGSASATATVGSLTSTTSASNVSNNFTELHDFDYAIEQSSQSQTAVCEAEIYINQFGTPFGEAIARANTQYFQFPNARIYLQSSNDENGNRNLTTIDLNDYVNYPVYKFDLARNFATLETDSAGTQSTVLYHTYGISHIDMSYVDTPAVGTPYTTISFGKVYKGILHLKTNLSTGSTISNYTSLQGYNNDDFIGRLYYNDDGDGGVNSVSSSVDWDYFDDPQAIWQNAIDGDWISAFSEIPWDATAEANVTFQNLSLFLGISWDSTNETWETGLNTTPPYSVANAKVYYYDPSTTALQRWSNGQPYYNDWQDIETLGYEVRYSSTSIEDLPGIDDFVSVEITGSISDPLLPNYQLEINNTEPYTNDRIAEAYISYVPNPEEQ